MGSISDRMEAPTAQGPGSGCLLGRSGSLSTCLPRLGRKYSCRYCICTAIIEPPSLEWFVCQKCARTVNQAVGSASSCFPAQPQGDGLHGHGAPKSGKLPLM